MLFLDDEPEDAFDAGDTDQQKLVNLLERLDLYDRDPHLPRNAARIVETIEDFAHIPTPRGRDLLWEQVNIRLEEAQA